MKLMLSWLLMVCLDKKITREYMYTTLLAGRNQRHTHIMPFTKTRKHARMP